MPPKKRTTGKKPATRKTSAKKSLKKPTAQKAPTKKSIAKKNPTKKPTARKAPTKKSATKRPTVRKNLAYKKPSTFKNPWFYSTILLLIIFAGVILYNKSFAFHDSINSILGLDNTISPQQPPIHLTVISDKEIQNMPYNLDEQITALEEEIDAEILVKKVDLSEDEATQLIADFEIKTLPVLIFNESLADTSFYLDASAFFTNIDGHYIMRVRPVKFLQIPEPSNGRKKGITDESVPVIIIAYNSFSCPYCTMMKSVFYQALEEYPDEVMYVFKHFNRGGADLALANASECAGEQDKFWEMHDYMFDNLDQLRDQGIDTFLDTAADNLSLDKEAFGTCNEEERYAELINEHTKEAHEHGLSGTPAIFINDTFVGGAVQYDTIEEIINSFIQ